MNSRFFLRFVSFHTEKIPRELQANQDASLKNSENVEHIKRETEAIKQKDFSHFVK